MFNSFRSSWKDKAAAAAAARDKGIPDGWRLPASDPLPIDSTILLASSGILTKAELVIIDQGAAQLATAIRLGKLTSEQVTIAYCKAAAIALQATNCLVELFVDEALARARELDAHFARTGEVVGPLHGVPVSIKDHIDVKGHDSPSGFLALVGKMVAKEDAYCVKVLRDVGAVFYCSKSSKPTREMSRLTDNNRNNAPAKYHAPRDEKLPGHDRLPAQPEPHRRWEQRRRGCVVGHAREPAGRWYGHWRECAVGA
jgi:amidase